AAVNVTVSPPTFVRVEEVTPAMGTIGAAKVISPPAAKVGLPTLAFATVVLPAFALRVMGPDKIDAVALELISAPRVLRPLLIDGPKLVMPAPLMTNGSLVEKPFRSTTPPAEMVVAPAAVPSAPALPSFKTPEATVSPTVNVLLPVSNRVF